LQERAEDVFARDKKAEVGPMVKDMQAKIGQLTLENDFFGSRVRSHQRCERQAMIDKGHDLPVVRQCLSLQCLLLPSAGIQGSAVLQATTLYSRRWPPHLPLSAARHDTIFCPDQ
jgi:hypothetical protein